METRSAPRQLTLRAILTGMVLGALLAPCNVYAGLKIGWAFNMSVAAALLSYGFWGAGRRVFGTPSWGLLENNINQTSASAAASIAGAGLVAPIPALVLLGGPSLSYGALVLWTTTVSLVGVVVAVAIRRKLIEVDGLAFPHGVATAHTVREIYSKGSEATARVRALLAGAGAAASLKALQEFVVAIPRLGLPLRVGAGTLGQYGWALDSSLMMLGFGAIIGLRAASSLALGAVVAWGFLAPWVVAQGWAEAGAPTDASWFPPLVEWLLWPGVAMMVTSSLTSFGLPLARKRASRDGAAALNSGAREPQDGASPQTDAEPASGAGRVSGKAFLVALAAVFCVAVTAQYLLFGIELWVGGLAVLFTFALAVVAGRVAGETGITPIGAMGKVTQLTFGVLRGGDITTNLMAANVTGGAASQCADMLQDLKTGHLIGASPRQQAVGQLFGVVAGAFSGSATYLLLIPNPEEQLLTPEWPAPAVLTWKAVAEVFSVGFDAAPTGSVGAMLAGGLVGVVLAVLEQALPPARSRWVPSAASVGLAFVLPAFNTLSIFVGALAAEGWRRTRPSSAARFTIVVAAGLVAGESLMGVVSSALGILSAVR